MEITVINGKTLGNMFVSGVNKLNSQRNIIDALNVFPVPDGDTGTNMSLTAISAAKAILEMVEPYDCADVMKRVSDGSLRGARGNSGVILSQLFRGMYKAIDGHDEIGVTDLARALRKASDTAYKAVMKPKDGTVLTVAAAVAEKAEELAIETDNVDEMLREILIHANAVVEQTTEMLQPLKDAGVVDAGGKGYAVFLEGFYTGLFQKAEPAFEQDAGQQPATPSSVREQDIHFGYCTEFFIDLNAPNEQFVRQFKKYLSSIGDSVVLVDDETMVKVHVHTDNPGLVLEKALSAGSLSNIKIDNMRLQHTNLINFDEDTSAGPSAPATPYDLIKQSNTLHEHIGIVAVSPGEGLAHIFKDLGVDVVIEGGQTMNPSADDFVRAARQIEKEEIIMLPNNKNIILAAEQAVKLLEQEKKVRIVPSKSAPQGISALSNCEMDLSLDEMAVHMIESLQYVKTGLLTDAVRDSVYEGRKIQTGDALGLLEDKIAIINKDPKEASEQLITLLAQDTDLITIYYGRNVPQEAAFALRDYASENTDCEVELHYGGQPVYDYILSAE